MGMSRHFRCLNRCLQLLGINTPVGDSKDDFWLGALAGRQAGKSFHQAVGYARLAALVEASPRDNSLEGVGALPFDRSQP